MIKGVVRVAANAVLGLRRAVVAATPAAATGTWARGRFGGFLALGVQVDERGCVCVRGIGPRLRGCGVCP